MGLKFYDDNQLSYLNKSYDFLDEKEDTGDIAEGEVDEQGLDDLKAQDKYTSKWLEHDVISPLTYDALKWGKENIVPPVKKYLKGMSYQNMLGNRAPEGMKATRDGIGWLQRLLPGGKSGYEKDPDYKPIPEDKTNQEAAKVNDIEKNANTKKEQDLSWSVGAFANTNTTGTNNTNTSTATNVTDNTQPPMEGARWNNVSREWYVPNPDKTSTTQMIPFRDLEQKALGGEVREYAGGGQVQSYDKQDTRKSTNIFNQAVEKFDKGGEVTASLEDFYMNPDKADEDWIKAAQEKMNIKSGLTSTTKENFHKKMKNDKILIDTHDYLEETKSNLYGIPEGSEFGIKQDINEKFTNNPLDYDFQENVHYTDDKGIPLSSSMVNVTPEGSSMTEPRMVSESRAWDRNLLDKILGRKGRMKWH